MFMSLWQWRSSFINGLPQFNEYMMTFDEFVERLAEGQS